MRYLVALCLFLSIATCVLAAGEPITIGETIKIPSKILGEERTILVSTPANYAQGTERYPVLYMTDGDAHLTHTRGTVDFLANNGLIPNLIIVGITNTDRTRDLSPTRWARPTGEGGEVQPPMGGGAPKFLDFFEQELFPFVESHYRTVPFRVFSGHSLGGLLSLHIMVARPELFNAYISVSPSLIWDDEYPLRSVEAFFKDRKEFPRTLFVTMANEEVGDPKPTRFDRLCATLGGVRAEGFVWDSKLMTDETHGSVVLRSQYWGLRKVFEEWQLPVDPQTRRFNGTLEDVKAHYAKLGKRLGMNVPIPEQTVNQLGYQLMGQDKVQEAVAVFRYNVELYPESANVYDSLGDGLQREGKAKEALASYEKAVEKATKNGDRRLPTFTQNRDRAAEAQKGAESVQEKKVNVGAYDLYFRVIPGKGRTILLESGGGMDSTEWTGIAEKMAKETGATVVSYDRAGFGKSDLPDSKYDLHGDTADLWRALTQLGLDKNLVLVGHSYGGFLIRYEASQHPAAVKGLVFVDPFTVEFVDALGVDKCNTLMGGPACDLSHPEALTKAQRADARMMGAPGNNLAEKMEVMRKTSVPKGIPVRVITSGTNWFPSPDLQKLWRDSQERFAASMPGAKLVVAEKSDHMVPEREPDLVVSTVAEVAKLAK